MPTLYHNPSCTKSRQAFALLEEKGIKADVRLYLKEQLNAEELLFLFNHYDGDYKDFLRDKEAKEEGFDNNFDKENLANFIIKNPRALQRPVFIDGKTVIIGRPHELLLGYFS